MNTIVMLDFRINESIQNVNQTTYSFTPMLNVEIRENGYINIMPGNKLFAGGGIVSNVNATSSNTTMNNITGTMT
jgi:hypothetical protein